MFWLANSLELYGILFSQFIIQAVVVVSVAFYGVFYWVHYSCWWDKKKSANYVLHLRSNIIKYIVLYLIYLWFKRCNHKTTQQQLNWRQRIQCQGNHRQRIAERVCNKGQGFASTFITANRPPYPKKTKEKIIIKLKTK